MDQSVSDMSGKEPVGKHKESSCDDSIVNEIQRSRWKKILTRLFGGVGIVLVLVILIGSASLTEPASYQAALAMAQADAKSFRLDFESRVIELGNIVREKKEWKTTFTQSEINGWLADNREFSKTLPKVISQPRVVLADARMSVIFRCEILGLDAIVQGELDVFCTETPGQIAMRIYRVRSGWVPLPLDAFTDQLTAGMLTYGAEVEWSEIDGDPVALMLFSEDSFQLGTKILAVQAVEIKERKLMITGKSKSKPF